MAFPSAAQSAPECPICSGSGWKTLEIPGKARRVTRCDCYFARRNERLLTRARIPPRYEHCSLETFWTRSSDIDVSISEALLCAEFLATRYPSEKTGLLLCGDIGTGKTHLAVGVIRALIQKGYAGIFFDYRELLKQIQNSYNPNAQVTELEILKPVFECEVLVLDELGAAKPSEWVWDAVQYILNTRYNRQLTTIITTNFPFGPETPQKPGESDEQFQTRLAGNKHKYTLGDRVGNRMISRLAEMCRVVPMTGADYRKKAKSANSFGQDDRGWFVPS